MGRLLQKVAGTMFLLLLLNYSHAQIVGTNAYVKGTYLEMGISSAGVFVADANAPAGYHDPGDLPTFGLIIDQGMDGWNSGTPPYCGDYFSPGSPEEGFAVQVGTDIYVNAPFTTEIPGSITSYSVTGTGKIVVWQGDIVEKGLHISETVTTKNNKRFVQVQVKILNTTGASISGVYYSRNTDPDNEQPFTGNFVTENVVLYNHPVDEWAMATAEGMTYGCLLALGSSQTNSRASYGGFSTVSLIPKQAYDGTSPHSLFGTHIGDEAITLTFKIGTILPGQTKILNFIYGADPDEITDALRLTTDEISAEQEAGINSENYFSTVMTLSPVPSNGNLNLIASGIDPDAEVQIEIFNSLGQVVYTYQPENNSGSIMHQINLIDGLANGTYFVRLMTGEMFTTESFILSR